MAEHVYIEKIADHVGEEVIIKGWLYAKTGKGKLQFLQVRDGTGIIQCVVFKKEVSPEAFDAAQRLTQESSLVVTGTVRADERAPGIPGGIEIDVTDLEVVQFVTDEYPITLKEHGIDFLLSNRHLWIRSSRQWATLRVRATIIKAIRDWLDDHGFILMDTPILTPAACEGTTTLFETDYHGTPAYLSQSGQLYNEADIMAFGKVYCFGPTFRAEKSKTRRHIQEFWMVEPEMAYVDLWGDLEVQEQFVSYVVQTTLERRRDELKLLGRDLSPLERVQPPFPRIHYDQAVEMINRAAKQGWWSSPTTSRCRPLPGATILARRTKPTWLPSSTGRSLSITTRPRSRPSTWPRSRTGPRPAALRTCWLRRGTARSSAAASARATWHFWKPRSSVTTCPAMHTSGTWTCGATARCRTAALAWAWSAPSCGSAA